MSEEEKEFTLVKGKRYKAEIHLFGWEDMAGNQKITNMLLNYGFTDVEVTGEGSIRDGIATWSGETITGPIERHIRNLEEIKAAPDPVVVPVSPPVFEKSEKKVGSSYEGEDDE